MRIAPERIEDAAKELYLRALKDLPPDIKRGFATLAARETGATAKAVLGTMIENIAVAERTGNLLCQDTGIPIYNVTIGRDAEVDGVALKAAIRRGCERATREYPLRSSIVHPLTRRNDHTSCGIGVPVIHVDFSDAFAGLQDRDDPQGQRLREQLVAADGDPGRGHRRDQDLRRRLRARRRRQDLPADDRGRRRRRHGGPVRPPRQGRGDAAARLALRGSRRRRAGGPSSPRR